MKMICELPGYEEFEGYGITSCGRVYSFKRNKFLKPAKNNFGYLQVHLYAKQYSEVVKIHRLVALAYISNPDNYETVDHIDGNKEHNYINNLQWMSREDNVVKSQAKPVYCVELDKTFESARAAARELNLNDGNISKVCNGKRKTTGNYHFQFVES